mmetsp:Transcript_46975/g.94145  ORF Transcript_46975/g.94145 Transcript_46975/m.94145 type:complete len:162 (-) Transcript_46975:56-541(-)
MPNGECVEVLKSVSVRHRAQLLEATEPHKAAEVVAAMGQIEREETMLASTRKTEDAINMVLLQSETSQTCPGEEVLLPTTTLSCRGQSQPTVYSEHNKESRHLNRKRNLPMDAEYLAHAFPLVSQVLRKTGQQDHIHVSKDSSESEESGSETEEVCRRTTR